MALLTYIISSAVLITVGDFLFVMRGRRIADENNVLFTSRNSRIARKNNVN